MSNASAHSGIEPPGRLCTGKTVLVLDDDPFLVEDLRQALDEQGGEVCTAYTANQAFAIIEDRDIDGAVLDVQLKEGTTAEVASELRRRHIPFVVISGYSPERLPAELQGAPYYGKPILTVHIRDLCHRLFFDRPDEADGSGRH